MGSKFTSIISKWNNNEADIDKIVLDYNAINAIVLDLCTDVENSSDKFDYVVAVNRGGVVLGTMVSNYLGIPMTTVDWSSRDDNSLVSGNKSSNWIPEDIANGKQVLLVDDISDSGDTFTSLLDDWGTSIDTELPMDNIKLMTLHVRHNAKIDVDYFGTYAKSTEWIVYPWEAWW